MGIQKTKGVDDCYSRMPDWAPKFLRQYAQTGEVKSACEYARISKQAHYQHLRNNELYRAAVQQTEDDVAQLLEDLAVERVRDGVRTLVLFQGEPVKVKGEFLYEVDYNVQLHQLLLKRFRPQQYRERASVDVSGEIDLVTALADARSRMIAIDADASKAS